LLLFGFFVILALQLNKLKTEAKMTTLKTQTKEDIIDMVNRYNFMKDRKKMGFTKSAEKYVKLLRMGIEAELNETKRGEGGLGSAGKRLNK
jgi:predicted ATP-grasp superfamily ATP-dependent carboligase